MHAPALPRLGLLIVLALSLPVPSRLEAETFIRGDVDGTGALEITDGVRIFGFLFLGQPADIGCGDVADTNDSGDVNLSDGVYVLNFLFGGGPAPPPPFPAAGFDPTADDGYVCGDRAEAPGPVNAGIYQLTGYRPADVVPDPVGSDAEIVAGRLLVDFENDVPLEIIDGLLEVHGLQRIGLVGAVNLVTATILNEKTELEAQEAIETEPEVECAPLAYLMPLLGSAGEALPEAGLLAPLLDDPREAVETLQVYYWHHCVMETFAAHGLAEAIIGTELSSVRVAVVDGGFQTQAGTCADDTVRSLLADPFDRDLVPKVEFPIGNIAHPAPEGVEEKPQTLVGEKSPLWNPLLVLEDNLHGAEVASMAVGSGRDIFLGTGKHARLIPARYPGVCVPPDAEYPGECDFPTPACDGTEGPYQTFDFSTAILSLLAEAADPDLKVINMSFGQSFFNRVLEKRVLSEEQAERVSDAMQDALALHEAAGRVIVAAAGNDGESADDLAPARLSVRRGPAGEADATRRLENLMVVSGTRLPEIDTFDNENGELEDEFRFEGKAEKEYESTNSGSVVSVSAPAQHLVSMQAFALEPTTRLISGTSFAAPLVAGLAAEMFAVDPSVAAREVIAIIQRTADDLGPEGWDPVFGHGRINCWKALLALVNRADPAHPRWLGIRLRSSVTGNRETTVEIAGDPVDVGPRIVPDIAQVGGDNSREVFIVPSDEKPFAVATLFSFATADIDPERLVPAGQLALLELKTRDGEPVYQLPLRVADLLNGRPVGSSVDDFVVTIELRAPDHTAFHGRVLSGGRPSDGARIEYTTVSGARAATVSDADGYYTIFDAQPDAPFQLVAQKGANRVEATVSAPPLRATRRDLVLDEAGTSSIAGVVREERGVNDAAPLAGARVTVEDATGQVVATAVTDAQGAYEITDVEPTWYVVRAGSETLPPVSRAIQVYAAAQGTVRRHQQDFVLLPVNSACDSDHGTFELIRGGAFLRFTGALFGSASLEEEFLNDFAARDFFDPETAMFCVSGDPARPTFSWNPEYLARRADVTSPVVDDFAVEEIVVDESGFERREARWYRGRDEQFPIEPPLRYGDVGFEAQSPPPLEKGRIYRVAINVFQRYHFDLRFRVR